MTSNLKYTVLTTPLGNGLIAQEVVQAGGDALFESVRTCITRRIIDTQDEQVRAALKELGWLPPEEAAALRSALPNSPTLPGTSSSAPSH